MDEQNYSPIKCTFLYSKKENVHHWEYDLYSALVTVDIWHLKGFPKVSPKEHVQKVQVC
jgi:hypothetical protein